MRLCVMVEGQRGVTWDEWVALARACERHGFEALFRSDHYGQEESGEEPGSLDAWTTLAGLAAITSSVRFGTLVSPVTFRHPAALAKSVVTVDHISGGRVELGLGSGWMEAEHTRHGFPFPPLRVRMAMLAEQLEIVHRQWGGEPFDFAGEHYRATGSDPRPKPVQAPHPPLIVGGRGRPRSVALAARWADEYNLVYATAEECGAVRGRIDAACEREGRPPLPLSLMTGFLVGADRGELLDRARRLGRDAPPGPPWLAGTPDDLVRQLEALAEAGVERVMLQHLLHTDLDALALVAEQVAPGVASA